MALDQYYLPEAAPKRTPQQTTVFLAEVLKDLHKYRDDQVIQVPMTLDTFKKFNEWLKS